MYSQKMYELGSKKSTIREIFEYGKQRAAIVGEENIYERKKRLQKNSIKSTKKIHPTRTAMSFAI